MTKKKSEFIKKLELMRKKLRNINFEYELDSIENAIESTNFEDMRSEILNANSGFIQFTDYLHELAQECKGYRDSLIPSEEEWAELRR